MKSFSNNFESEIRFLANPIPSAQWTQVLKSQPLKLLPNEATINVINLTTHLIYFRSTLQKDLVDTAVSAGNFKTLAAALRGRRPRQNSQRGRSLHGVCTY